ncbi:glycosyltransferase family 9 protein [Lentisphaerota bacterium WC36G]|nr:glycosyltransferase family 9 protein [Lentisphaerae bacterium WC36]
MLKNGQLSILITRLQNIGDMLAFIPALRNLRQYCPDAHIALLTKHAGGVEIIKNCPYVDEIITVRNRSLKEKMRLVRKFRRLRIDYFLISPQDLGRVPWALMGGAKKIIGNKKIKYCQVTKKEKLTSFIDIEPKYSTDATETENCASVVRAALEDMNIDLPNHLDLSYEYSWFKKESYDEFADLMGKYHFNKHNYAVIAPFSAKRSSKNWSNEKWAKICEYLIKEKNIEKLVFAGGPAEGIMINGLIAQLTANIQEVSINLAGETSLDLSALIIHYSNIFVGLDSGPCHLASAVNTPAVVLYGPGDFNRWYPPETTAPRHNIYLGVDCSPCDYKDCPVAHDCMKLITVNDCIFGIDEVLKDKDEQE